jgi:hypothetical protein
VLALASYARQIEDRELEGLALRIRASAICRSGEASRGLATPLNNPLISLYDQKAG